MSDFVILSNFRATIGIVSPTLLIAWFQRSETTEVVKVAQNFSSTVGQVVKALPFHGGNMGSIPIRCIFARIRANVQNRNLTLNVQVDGATWTATIINIKSIIFYLCAVVAVVARKAHNLEVVGSNPTCAIPT